MENLISSVTGWVGLKVEDRPVLAVISTVLAVVLSIGALAWAMMLLATAAT